MWLMRTEMHTGRKVEKGSGEILPNFSFYFFEQGIGKFSTTDVDFSYSIFSQYFYVLTSIPFKIIS